MSKKKKAVAPAENVVYVGPSIKGVITQSTVFKEGKLPMKAQECIEELPMMAKLFVPLSKLPAAQKELKKDGSALSIIYARTAAKF